MNGIQRLAGAARRRLMLVDAIERCGRAAVWGGSVGLLAVLVGKFVGESGWLVGWPGVVSVLAIAGIWGAAWAVARRLRPLEALMRVDAALGSRDRLSTGLALLVGAANEHGLHDLAREDAEALAQRVELHKALPVRRGWARRWGLGLGLALAAVGLSLLFPVDALGWHRKELAAARHRAAVQDALAHAAKVVEKAKQPIGPGEATAEQEKLLAELQKELEKKNGELSPGRAADRGAAAMEKLAEKADAKAAQLAREDQALRDQLTAAGQETGTPERSQSRLVQALKRGDLQEAAEAAKQELSHGAGAQSKSGEQSAPPDPKELERLADNLEKAAEQAKNDNQSSKEQNQQHAGKQQSSQNENGKDDPEAAERREQEQQRQSQETAAQQQAQRDARKLAQQLRKAAREQEERSGKSTGTQKGDQQSQGSQAEQGKQGQQGQQENSQSGQTQQAPGQQSGQQSGQQPGQQPGNTPGDDLARTLEQLAQRGEQAQQQRSAGQSYREAARDMLSKSGGGWQDEPQHRTPGGGPGSRPGLNREAAATPSPPERSELIDARGQNVGEKGPPPSVAAEWLGAGKREPGEPGAFAKKVQAASRSAERAIETHSVPSRFDRILSRYFDRLPEAVQPKEEKAAAPAKDAP